MSTTTNRKDVPLSHAMVAWNEFRPEYPDYDGRIVVVHWPDTTDQSRGFINTDCACAAKWHELTQREQMAGLLLCAMEIIIEGGINPKEVHAALSVIHEYRQMTRGVAVHAIWD